MRIIFNIISALLIFITALLTIQINRFEDEQGEIEDIIEKTNDELNKSYSDYEKSSAEFDRGQLRKLIIDHGSVSKNEEYLKSERIVWISYINSALVNRYHAVGLSPDDYSKALNEVVLEAKNGDDNSISALEFEFIRLSNEFNSYYADRIYFRRDKEIEKIEVDSKISKLEKWADYFQILALLFLIFANTAEHYMTRNRLRLRNLKNIRPFKF